MFVSLRRVCVVYVIKEVVSFWWLSQLMGVACKRTHATNTNICCSYIAEKQYKDDAGIFNK